jgi:G3E family GTPase
VEFADVLILNKTDLVTDAQQAQLKHLLHKLNPSAKVNPGLGEKKPF